MVVHVEDADHERVIGPNRSCGKPSDRPSGGGPASVGEVRDPRRAASLSRVKARSYHCNNYIIKILETRSSSRLTPSCGVALDRRWRFGRQAMSPGEATIRGKRRSESPDRPRGRRSCRPVQAVDEGEGGARARPQGARPLGPGDGLASRASMRPAASRSVRPTITRPTRRRGEIADLDRPGPPGQGLKPPRASAPVPPANPSASPRIRPPPASPHMGLKAEKRPRRRGRSSPASRRGVLEFGHDMRRGGKAADLRDGNDAQRLAP